MTNITRYRAMLNTETKTMKSSDLHQLVFNETGKFGKLKNFHKKVRQVLEYDRMPSAQLLPNGAVKFYNLNEAQSKAVMASIVLNQLELIPKIFVAVKAPKD